MGAYIEYAYHGLGPHNIYICVYIYIYIYIYIYTYGCMYMYRERQKDGLRGLRVDSLSKEPMNGKYIGNDCIQGLELGFRS